MNDNINNALGERVNELSAEQMQVGQEDGVANLLQARNHDASPPQTRYFVEEEDLKRPEVRLSETLNGRTVSIFRFLLFLSSIWAHDFIPS